MGYIKDDAIRNYGITFPKTEEETWPKHFQTLFKGIKKLGLTQHAGWTKDNITQARWRTNIASQAIELADAADKLRQEHTAPDEPCWRRLESMVFKHLEKEPRCKLCQGRIWQSDVSVPLAEFGIELDNIEPGMKRRECYCEFDSAGARDSFTFGSMGGAFFAYTAAVQKATRRDSEAPDIAFGLQSKGRVNKCAESVQRIEFAKDVPLHPFKPRSDLHLCLFPFLLSESKAGKANVTQQGILHQMAFPIRQALFTQQNLSVAFNETRAFEPLVWSLVLHGELYEIHAAYFKGTYRSSKYKGDDPKPKIIITRLWYGYISDHSAALQFLLIIDYIAEWARNIYREQVIDCLEKIIDIEEDSGVDSDSSEESCSSVNDARFFDRVDSDRYTSDETAQNGSFSLESSAHPTPASTPTQPAQQTESLGETSSPALHSPLPRRYASRTSLSSGQMSQGNESTDSLERFDGEKCVFRDATFIESRTAGIVITSDNIEDFVKDGDDVKHGGLRRLATQLRKYELAKITGSTLASMVETWTSSPSSSLARCKVAKEDSFFVLFSFAAFLSPDWKQVRELSYIAVSDSEILRVQDHVRAKVKRFQFDEIDPERAASMIDAFRSGTVHANLTGCLYRTLLHPVSKTAPRQGGEDILRNYPKLKPIYMVVASPEKRPPRDYIWEVSKKLDDNGCTRLSSKPYFHQSINVELQRQPFESRFQSGAPWTTYAISRDAQLVLGEDEFYNRDLTVKHLRQWCLFVVGKSTLGLEKQELMKYTPSEVYRTCRHCHSKGWEMEGWNCIRNYKTGSHIYRISSDYTQILLKCLGGVNGKFTAQTNAVAQMKNLEPSAVSTARTRSRRSNVHTSDPDIFASASSDHAGKQKSSDLDENVSEDELLREVQDCNPRYRRRDNY